MNLRYIAYFVLSTVCCFINFVVTWLNRWSWVTACDPLPALSPCWRCCEGETQTQVSVTNFGRVNGVQRTQYNKKVNTYVGIPFARPPTGNLRFRPPEPLPPPDDATEYNATKLPASCYQARDTDFHSRYVDIWNPNTVLKEDCLYLNIWQPDNARNRPVMVRLFLLFTVISTSLTVTINMYRKFREAWTRGL